jgi:hypothetical protein
MLSSKSTQSSNINGDSNTTIRPTIVISPLLEQSEKEDGNDNKMDSHNSIHNDINESLGRKKSKRLRDSLFSKVTHFFSQGSSGSDGESHRSQSKTRSIHSSHSNSHISISTMNSTFVPTLTSKSPVQEPESMNADVVNPIHSSSDTVASNKSKVHKKRKTKHFSSSILYNSSSDNNSSDSSSSSISKRKKRSSLFNKKITNQSSDSMEITNIPLPDGQVAIEHHPLLKHRIDYVLQENISDVIKGSYVTALGAHTSYWQNRLLIYHIMKTIITKTEYEKSQQNEALPSPLM